MNVKIPQQPDMDRLNKGFKSINVSFRSKIRMHYLKKKSLRLLTTEE